jgi:hypothetical protein
MPPSPPRATIETVAKIALPLLLGDPPPLPDREPRLPWAHLLLRVHAIDVLTCRACGGPMRILAFITEPIAVRRILAHLGLPFRRTDVAPRAPPRPAEELLDPLPLDEIIDPAWPPDLDA